MDTENVVQKRQTNVLIICTEKIPSAWIGVYQPLFEMKKNNILNVTFKVTREVNKNDLLVCDVLICVRGSEELEYKIAKVCKAAGKFICYYLDDDLLNIPQDSGCAAYYNDEMVRRNIIAIIETCDVFMSPNPKIIERYKEHTSRNVVVKGPATMLEISDEIIKKESNPIKIGFAGGIGHAVTLEKIAKNAILKIDQEYDSKVKFEFVGAKPKFLANMKNYEYISYMEDPIQYREYMKNCHWDIALAPLPEEEFYKCKYFNKFLEYGAIKASGIYSNTEPFTYIVEDMKTGILCDNEDEYWYEALKKLIEGKKLRQEIADNALLKLKEQFALEAVGKEMTLKIPELIEYKASPQEIQVRFLNKYYNRCLLWFNKTCRIFKIHPILGVFVIAFLIVRKIFRIVKRKIGG